MSRGLQVVHIQRRPAGSQVSLERVFRELRDCSPADIDYRIHVSPCFSTGIAGRLVNLLAARLDSGRINHIVGDVQYLALALPGNRTILTIHDCAPLQRMRGLKRELVRLLWYEWPAQIAKVVTTGSHAAREELRRFVAPRSMEKVHVIHDCVRREFRYVPRSGGAPVPVILQVGTGWNKNLANVGRALEGVDCRLDIVGPLSSEQRALLEGLRVNYRALGTLDDEDLVRSYRECDIVVFASLYEGFGLPIVEAQATGRPVVTSRRGCMPEVAGDAALFVDPEDVGAIRSAVQQLLLDRELRESLVAAGLENVGRFRAPRIASQFAALYRELA